jgi:hypothetical protein
MIPATEVAGVIKGGSNYQNFRFLIEVAGFRLKEDSIAKTSDARVAAMWFM